MHDLAHAIGNVAARSGSTQAIGVMVNIPVSIAALMVDITIHRFAGRLIFEFETAASGADTEVALSLTQTLVRRLDQKSEVGDLVSSRRKTAASNARLRPPHGLRPGYQRGFRKEP